MDKIEKFIKYIALLAFVMIFINLSIIMVTSPAKYYEISIFGAYSSYYIFLLALPISLGLIILVLSSGYKINSGCLKFGLLTIILGNSVVLLLPLFRGYALYGLGDPLVHVGYINDIVKTGMIGESNFYPLIHILDVMLSFCTDMHPMQVMLVFPTIFNIIYILGLLLIGSQIVDNYLEAPIIVAFGGVLLFTYYGSQFLPTSFSMMLIPLTLYLLIKSNESNDNELSYIIIFIITLFFISIFHPVSILNLIMAFVIFWFFSVVLSKYDIFKQCESSYYINFFPILMLTICFITWFSQFAIFQGTVYVVSNWFLHQMGSPPSEVYGKRLDEVSLPLSDLINYLLQGYGHELIYFLLASCFITFIVWKIAVKDFYTFKHEIIFSTMFVIFSLSTLLIHFGSLMINNPQRQFLYSLMIATILNGMLFIRLFKKNSIIYILLAVFILIPCCFVGISSSYSTVLMGVVNSQVTPADLRGTSWFIDNCNYEINTVFSINNELYRFIYALKGRDFENRANTIKQFKRAPPMFEISSNDSYYLTLSDYAKTKYTVYWPNSPEFPKEVIDSLNSVIQLNKIYNNRGITCYSHH